jgi:tetraacyldisaccharide 4'-kinase
MRLLSLPYELTARGRAAWYRWGWLATKRLPIRVISIGNLTVGGTGKTPMVIWIAQQLVEQGRRVAVLSRGYRRKSGEAHLLVSDGHQLLANPIEAGDEPFLIARRCPRAIVAVGSDRYELGRWLLDRVQVDDIILDDGFQHLSLWRDLNLLLMDATDVDGLRGLFPFGRLREPLSAATRASILIVTRASEGSRAQIVTGLVEDALGHRIVPIEVDFAPERLINIVRGVEMEAAAAKEKTAVAVSAVGNPASFERLLRELGLRVGHHLTFRDHHAYRAVDVEAVQGRADACRADLIVTTEKDACKLVDLLGPDDAWWAVRLQPRFRSGEADLLAILNEPFP